MSLQFPSPERVICPACGKQVACVSWGPYPGGTHGYTRRHNCTSSLGIGQHYVDARDAAPGDRAYRED